jgi:hypothetical protein
MSAGGGSPSKHAGEPGIDTWGRDREILLGSLSIWQRPVCLCFDHPTEEDAMRYILLIYHGDTPTPQDPDAWGRLSADERQQIFGDYQALNQTPGVTPGERMDAPDTSTTVRVSGGETLVTDGPFAAMKEALGGYLLFEADDLDRAIELAARIPAARLGGGIEIRPLVGS